MVSGRRWLRFEQQPGVLSNLADSAAPPLAEFLLARIAEDEREASARDGEAMRWPSTGWDEATSQRAHAECEAKRRIADLADEATGLDLQVDGEFRVGGRDMAAEPWLGDLILRALALPYASHPDYDEAWKP